MSKVFIIAEAGVNHNGSMRIARSLIDAAAGAGCDAIKFQTFKAEKLVVLDAPKAGYQIKRVGNKVSQYSMLKALELSGEDHVKLLAHCKKAGIIFMSTPFDEASADLLDGLGMKIFKIPSGELTNKPLVEHIAKKAKEIILSTGMSNLEEVGETVGWIGKIWKSIPAKPRLTLLHCTSNYPALPEEANLLAMKTLGSSFGLETGYSDHTLGIEVPIAAVAIGARVIEKHFTLDRNMPGPDHVASTDPQGLRAMVKGIRNIEKAMGSPVKRPVRSERDVIRSTRRSLVAARDIAAGQVIGTEDITVKRPGTGLPPSFIDMVVNTRAVRDIYKDEILRKSFFKPRPLSTRG